MLRGDLSLSIRLMKNVLYSNQNSQIEEVMLREEGEIFICYTSIYISWIISVPGILSVAHMFVLGSWKKTDVK